MSWRRAGDDEGIFTVSHVSTLISVARSGIPMDNAADSSVLELGKGGSVHFVWVADEEEKTNLTFASVHKSRLCCFLRNRLTVIRKKA